MRRACVTLIAAAMATVGSAGQDGRRRRSTRSSRAGRRLRRRLPEAPPGHRRRRGLHPELHAARRARGGCPQRGSRELRSDLLLVKTGGDDALAAVSRRVRGEPAVRCAIAISGSTSCSSTAQADARDAGSRAIQDRKLALQPRPDHADDQHADDGDAVLRAANQAGLAVHARQGRQRQALRGPGTPRTSWMIEFREAVRERWSRATTTATSRRTAASGSTAPPAASCERS